MKLMMCTGLFVCSGCYVGLSAAARSEDIFAQGLKEFAAFFALSQSVDSLPMTSSASSFGQQCLEVSSSTDCSFGGSFEMADDKKVLFQAAENGDLPTVQEIIRTGKINLNVCDKVGNTALIVAVLYGHIAVAKAIAASGKALINVLNDAGNTALMLSAQAGYADLVGCMLRVSGTNIAMENADEKTALMLAREFGQEEVVAVFTRFSEQHSLLRRPMKKE